jgi:hypothetical protein
MHECEAGEDAMMCLFGREISQVRIPPEEPEIRLFKVVDNSSVISLRHGSEVAV